MNLKPFLKLNPILIFNSFILLFVGITVEIVEPVVGNFSFKSILKIIFCRKFKVFLSHEDTFQPIKYIQIMVIPNNNHTIHHHACDLKHQWVILGTSMQYHSRRCSNRVLKIYDIHLYNLSRPFITVLLSIQFSANSLQFYLV